MVTRDEMFLGYQQICCQLVKSACNFQHRLVESVMLCNICSDYLSCTCQLKDFIRQAHQMTADKPPDICTAKAPGKTPALQVKLVYCVAHDHVQHNIVCPFLLSMKLPSSTAATV